MFLERRLTEAVLEIRVNLVLMAVLGCVWLGMRAHAPARIIVEGQSEHLAQLEDAFARDRTDTRSLVALTDAYLEAGHAQLAIVTVRAAEPVLLEQPAVAHQLAKAYESTGRLLDALATADLALARCSRALGAEPLETSVPHYACTERTYAKLDTHKSALEKMVRWGIVDPRVDPRAQKAYEMALRRARIAVNGDGLPQQLVP